MIFLKIDNTAVRLEQIERLNELKANRDEAAVQKKLWKPLPNVCKTKQGNLLELAVKAAGLRATLGEISDACEAVVGRYKAINQNYIRRVFIRNKKDADFKSLQN